mmetsp:Transcript_13166/g.18633  ORF Transcript_13166/g.18633 Transcript_13166/m.18633 type:complete len:404 (-) Transcript_13166:292-1503(-)
MMASATMIAIALSVLVTLLCLDESYGFHINTHHRHLLTFVRQETVTRRPTKSAINDRHDRTVLRYKDFEEECEDDEPMTTTTALLWEQAGDMAAFGLPSTPSADLSAEHVVSAIVRGLQYNDIPTNNTGIVRCFEFMDIMCKKGVTGYGSLPEERTLEFFVPHAIHSAKLRPFIGCETVVMGNVSYIPGTLTRGTIATCPVKVVPRADPILHDSGFARDAIRLNQPEQTFMFHLQQQRRPPLQGAYTVTDIVNVESRKHWFQDIPTSKDAQEQKEAQKKQEDTKKAEDSFAATTTAKSTATSTPTTPTSATTATANKSPLQEQRDKINHRKQPLPQKQEVAYAAKLKAIVSLEEKAFIILLDLGMIQVTPDPDHPDYDSSNDDVFAEHTTVVIDTSHTTAAFE